MAMITSKLIRLTTRSKLSLLFSHLGTNKYTQLQKSTQSIRSVTSQAYNYDDSDGWYAKRIGNREVVGYGLNGEPEYIDRLDFPFPSIRYKSPSPEFLALREKEKGDWRLLSIDEKRELYRSNFCQTFVEIDAPTGEWMLVTGITFILVSVGLWMFILMKLYVYSKTPIPDSFSSQSVKMQLKRMLILRVNPMTGISSKWDYEKKKWRNKPWYIDCEDPFDESEPVMCEEDL